MSDWKQDWQEVIDAVGQDFSDGQVHYGADAVEASAIRRYLEPLELDCALHHDAATAREHGACPRRRSTTTGALPSPTSSRSSACSSSRS